MLAQVFTPGESLAPGLLWVLEQLPGPYVVASDHTPYLEDQGYWASYNRIANPFLFDLANQTALEREYGDHYSWSRTSRAQVGGLGAPRGTVAQRGGGVCERACERACGKLYPVPLKSVCVDCFAPAPNFGSPPSARARVECALPSLRVCLERVWVWVDVSGLEGRCPSIRAVS